jgi:demethylmenaquinone methyltransferase/2-methoxy-6-polyprenyl-1,4-benzoquinol methylase
VARVVRPGGRIALLETAQPPNAVMRWGHAVYFTKIVPRIGGWLSDRDAYTYLPRSTAYLPPPNELVQLFARAGFPDITRTRVSGGIAQLLSGTRA